MNGAFSVAAWKWRSAAAVMPVFQPCGITSAPCSERELGDPPELGEAAAPVDVGLEDVDPPALEPLAALVHGRGELGAGDARLDALGELRVPVEVVVRSVASAK